MTVFQKAIENSLFDVTGWEDHRHIVVGVHRSYCFNGCRVPGVIDIFAPDDWTEDNSDFSDADYLTPELQMTAQDARALASALIEAADAAEKVAK